MSVVQLNTRVYSQLRSRPSKMSQIPGTDELDTAVRAGISELQAVD